MNEEQGEAYRVYGELFRGLTQLAPGSSTTTLAILAKVRAFLPDAPCVVDMGCGAGGATLTLAAALPAARFVALDLGEEFLERLRAQARIEGCSERIVARAGDIGDPAAVGLEPASVDFLWSAAAAYGIGIEAALATWKPLLRAGGVLALSELVWVEPKAARSPASQALWGREYPAMRLADEVEATVRASGLEPMGRLRQPRADWEAYYGPLRGRVAAMRQDAADGSVAKSILDGMQQEIDVFDSGDTAYAYEFFLSRRKSDDESSGGA